MWRSETRTAKPSMKAAQNTKNEQPDINEHSYIIFVTGKSTTAMIKWLSNSKGNGKFVA
jgi:hypothetical protein